MNSEEKIFNLLGRQELDESLLESLTDDVMAEVKADSARVQNRRVGSLVAAAAAVLLLGAVLLPFLSDGDAEYAGQVDAGIDSGRIRRAGVEVLSTPGQARVVDMTVGETQVVMIFDERLEL